MLAPRREPVKTKRRLERGRNIQDRTEVIAQKETGLGLQVGYMLPACQKPDHGRIRCRHGSFCFSASAAVRVSINQGSAPLPWYLLGSCIFGVLNKSMLRGCIGNAIDLAWSLSSHSSSRPLERQCSCLVTSRLLTLLHKWL